MAQSISARIFETFFARLSEMDEVRPETLEALRRLYGAGRMDNRQKLKRLTQDVEKRHAQDQNADD